MPHFLEKTLWTSTDIQGWSLGEACDDLVHCTCPWSPDRVCKPQEKGKQTYCMVKIRQCYIDLLWHCSGFCNKLSLILFLFLFFCFTSIAGINFQRGNISNQLFLCSSSEHDCRWGEKQIKEDVLILVHVPKGNSLSCFTSCPNMI